MKKIILGALVAISAICSQAATVSWTLTNVNQDGTGVSGAMYIFTTETAARDAILALAGQGADAVSTAMEKATITWTVSNGTGSVGATSADKVDISSVGLAGNTQYEFFAVVFDTATITDDSSFYVSAIKSQTMADASTANNKVIGWGSQATASAAEGAWNAVAVPEPTSGLLMLVGLAGLALRRRRA